MLINHGIRLTLPELPVMIDGKYKPRYEIKPVMPKVELMRKGGVVYGRMPLITKKKDLKC
jgi:hypothetical protein